MTRHDAVRWLKAVTMIGVYGGLLLPLVFIPKVIFPFVFSKLIFFQVLIGLTFPSYIALAWIEKKFRPKFIPLTVAIAAYFTAVLLSVIFAVDPLRAWWGNQERMNGLFTVIHFFAWYLMTTSLLTTWKQWKRILIYEVALSGIMGAVALLQKPFPNLLLFPAAGRVGGLLDNPIYMAAYQIFNLFFIMLLWLRDSKWSLRIWLIPFAILDIGAFIAAESRGALVGLAAGVVIFAVATVVLGTSKKAKIAVLGSLLLFFGSYGVLYSLRNTQLVQQSPLGRLTDLNATTETRFIAWKIGWQGFLERPLTGWGFDDFHILFNKKYNPASLEYGYYETWFDRAHNTVVDMLSMTGIFGFLTYFGIFGSLFWSVWRAYKKKWIDVQTACIFFALPCAYFVQNLFVFDQPAGFTMSYFLYAFVAAATVGPFLASAEPAPDTGTAQVKVAPWIGFAVIQLCALLIVWRYSILPWNASVLTIQSNNYFAARLYDQSFALAKQAAQIPTPYLDEQTFLQSRNLLTMIGDGSIKNFPQWKEWHDLVKSINEQQLKDHPENTNPHFVFARYLQSFANLVPEDGVEAETEFQKAIQTSPKRQQLYYSLAQYYVSLGRKQDANDLLVQALEFDPNVGESHWYVGVSLMFDLNKQAEGAIELSKAESVKSPYQLKDVREAVVLSQVYAMLKDPDGFKKLLTLLPSLSGGTTQAYLEIARQAEKLGLINERNLILGAIIRIDPTLQPHLVPLENGSATSIEQSFKMADVVTLVPNVTTTPVTTSTVPSGPGPRR